MPTPAKLVSAILFAALAWLVGEIIVRDVLPEGTQVGWMREMLAAGAFFAGWRVLGRAATGPTGRGDRITVVLTAGIGTALVIAVLAALLHAFSSIIIISLEGGVFTELGRAVSAGMSIVWDDVQIMLVPQVGGTFLLGGGLIGLIAGIVGRRFP